MTASSANRRLTVSIPIQVASVKVAVSITICRTCTSNKQTQDSAGLAAGRTSRLFYTETRPELEQLLDAIMIFSETALLVWQLLRISEQESGRKLAASRLAIPSPLARLAGRPP